MIERLKGTKDFLTLDSGVFHEIGKPGVFSIWKCFSKFFYNGNAAHSGAFASKAVFVFFDVVFVSVVVFSPFSWIVFFFSSVSFSASSFFLVFHNRLVYEVFAAFYDVVFDVFYAAFVYVFVVVFFSFFVPFWVVFVATFGAFEVSSSISSCTLLCVSFLGTLIVSTLYAWKHLLPFSLVGVVCLCHKV